MAQIHSIMTNVLTRCYICKTTNNIHIHHIFYGKNRNNSDKDGCVIPLCQYHHTGNKGVHHNKKLDLEIKRKCEYRWLEVNNATIDDFIKRYRINYL